MPLTDTACRSLKPQPKVYKRSDGGGLQLWVQPTGSKQWRLAYRYFGKQKSLSLGSYPAVTLSEARTARDVAKQQLAKGMDPSAARKAAKANNFQAISEEFLSQQRLNGRAEATMNKLAWLLTFAYPALGAKPVADIRPAEILGVLRRIESRGNYETARRLRSTIGCVCRFAIATGRAETDPTYSLRGALANPAAKHRAAITDPKGFGALLRAIEGFDGQPTTVAALKLMALLFPRPGELRGAHWSEFDLDSAVWAIPASRMKMRRPHRAPLSRQALAILLDLQALTGRGIFVFPSVRTAARPLSENTLNSALRRLGYTKLEMSAHGFRASASTLLNESGQWHADAIERQLAHVEGNGARAAYARGQHWDERVRMMQAWADHLDQLKTVGKVVPIKLQSLSA